MPLIPSSPPLRAEIALHSATWRSHLLRGEVVAVEAHAPIGGAGLHLALPHPVYALGTDSIVARRAISAARRTGWRALVDKGGEVIAATEVSRRRAGSYGGAVNRGRFVAATVTHVLRLEEELADKQEDFEVRLLRVPAICVVALWLHVRRSHPGHDVIVPLTDVGPLAEGRQLSPTEFLDLIRPLALDRFSDAPDEPVPG